MTQIKAIETVYNGYRFRSRLEARWAVFFDVLGVEYQYEPEGFDLNGIQYLPDFYLPKTNGGLWAEIKPIKQEWPECIFFDFIYDGNDVAKCTPNEILPNCGWPGFILLSGQPGYDNDGDFTYNGTVEGDTDYLWCECSICKVIGVEYRGRSERLCNCYAGDKGYNMLSPRLRSAYIAARQARFEHGEKPFMMSTNRDTRSLADIFDW